LGAVLLFVLRVFIFKHEIDLHSIDSFKVIFIFKDFMNYYEFLNMLKMAI